MCEFFYLCDRVPVNISQTAYYKFYIIQHMIQCGVLCVAPTATLYSELPAQICAALRSPRGQGERQGVILYREVERQANGRSLAQKTVHQGETGPVGRSDRGKLDSSQTKN